MTAEDKSRREVEQLKVEKARLLDELEMSYRNLEEVLSTSHREAGIAYEELRKKNQELQRKLAEVEAANNQLHS